ncbi:hypothetical protein BV898_09158 [Hypsibius exemplaris]|uniref:Uncharacterized protein n=1 Tax=Hypsibius exemplaris TaxID=2072580 RepID=A0A1W0WNQ2_HYPEX|nr:hypothetical protein BV898_09158 [Hypsibius exemplaris]
MAPLSRAASILIFRIRRTVTGGQLDLETDGLDIVVEDGGDSARKNILENPEHRSQVINELHELLAFLQRRLEEQSVDHMASDLLSVHLGESRHMGDKKTVNEMIGNVKEILALFDDHRLQSLCKLHDSTTFLDRLTKQLEQKLTFCDRMESRAGDFQLRRAEALSEREKIEPELAKLIAATRKIQRFLEQDISKRYQDRRVTILGGAQSLN